MILKPKFNILYILIALLTIAVLAILAYFNYTGDISASYFSIFSIGIIILGVVAIVATFFKYLALTYKISDTEVILSEGIITKSVRTVPMKKIDNISIKRDVRDLILTTGSIHIDTPAGGGAVEIIMKFVDAGKLDEIESRLKQLMGKTTPTAAEPPKLEEPPELEEEAEEEPAEEEKEEEKPAKKKKGKKK